MRTHRIEIAVPYRATVVPRGARAPREVVYRAPLVIDLPVVSPGDMSLAVSCTDVPRRYVTDDVACDYLGYGGSLWLPMRDFDEPDLLLRVETALHRLSIGAEDLEDGEVNPFTHVGPRPVSKAAFLRSRSIDDVLLREHVEDDRSACLASAVELASDLMLCEDGRVLRRSPGPFFGIADGKTVDVTACRFSLPTVLRHPFGAARLAEAVECFATMVPDRPPVVVGKVEIHEPDCVPDLDAIVSARLATPRYWARMFRSFTGDEPSGHRVAADAAIAAGALIRGLDPDYHVGRESNPDPQGVRSPTASQLVEAVELTRAFAENNMFAADGPVSPSVMSSVRDLWRETMEPHLIRWDVFERDRLPVLDAAPDLEAPGFGAAP